MLTSWSQATPLLHTMVKHLFQSFSDRLGENSGSSKAEIYSLRLCFTFLFTGIEIGIFLEPLNLPNKKLVFFAVNDNDSKCSAGGSHW